MSLARDEQNVQPGELAYCDGVEVNGGALRPTVLELVLTSNMLFWTKTVLR